MATNRHVFLEISIDGEVKGRIVVELFDKEVPKTAENFHALCTGERGEELHYKGSCFSNVIPNFMCHGGDGIGSIYGDQFPVELTDQRRSFELAFLVCTALPVPDGNADYACGSGFYITFASTTWLNPRHTIFGKVVHGFDVVLAIGEVGTLSGVPKKEVKISDCGKLNRGPTNWSRIVSAPTPSRASSSTRSRASTFRSG